MTEARIERLRESAARLRSRSGGGDVDRLVLRIGAALFPLGILVILLGWYGAANTPYSFEQLPYLISGGLVGLALVGVGGFLYFGYWLTRLLNEGRDQARRTGEALERIERLLADSGAPAGTATAPPAPAAGQLVATAKGTMVHRHDCAVVAGKSGLRRLSASAARGLEPCKLCQPR